MNNKFKIKINTIDRAKKIVNICNTFKEDIDLSSGRYIVDAKSIMGILSFDLTKPFDVCIHSHNVNIVNEFNKQMSEYKYEY